MQGRKLSLFTEPYRFNCARWCRWKLTLSWYAETEAPNVVATLFISVGVQWLPIKWLEGFFNLDELEVT